MPFFSKSIDQLATTDLAELLEAQATETVRLEFKREGPGPDDSLKKLSGFANTFGGYLIIGAAANSATGRLESLPGIEPVHNLKQTLIQRCNEGVWPPMEFVVSEGIPSPEDRFKQCYVVYTPESTSAPHFLNRGKGAWIRSDEFSQRFETRLANYEQITHLGNRRQLAVERREQLFGRALIRYDTFIGLDYATATNNTGQMGANAALSLCPVYPSTKLIDEYQLVETLQRCGVRWRQVGFPWFNEAVTQLDSVISLQPKVAFSMVEVSTWGQIFYAWEVEHLAEGEDGQPLIGIHLYAFLGHMLVFLEYGRSVYRAIGYNGPLRLRCVLRKVRGKSFMYFPANAPQLGPSSRLDDEVEVDLTLMGTRLDSERDAVARDLFKLLFFAMNWSEQAQDARLLGELLNKAYYYNMWPT